MSSRNPYSEARAQSRRFSPDNGHEFTGIAEEVGRGWGEYVPFADYGPLKIPEERGATGSEVLTKYRVRSFREQTGW